MERLTYRSHKFNNPVSHGACKDITCYAKCDSCKINDLIAKLCAYEDTGLEPEEILYLGDLREMKREIIFGVTAERLKELAEADKAGRLEVLPCKVGDHVWADGREAIVVWFLGYKTERYLHAQFFDNAKHTDIPFYEIGKNRLPDREEADDAMKEANHA